MPGTNFSHAIANNESDPYGIGQVSGFYGPGTWASWVIALTSSWINLFKRCKAEQEAPSYDLIAHLLYTNWAAVDLLRHIFGAHGTIASLAAAIVVSYWGLFHAFWQYMWVGCYCDITRNRRKRKVLLTLAIGLVLPSTALLSFLGSFYIGKKTLATYILNAVFVDKKEVETVTSDFNTATGIIGAMFLTVLAAKICEECAKEGWKAVADTDAYEVLFVISALLLLGIVFCVGFFMLCLIPIADDLKGFVLQPCTALPISDWDQSFALVCALLFYVRGAWVDIYRLVGMCR